MTTIIPNTSTTGTVGTPPPASIATESVDNTVVPATSDIIQQMSEVNMTAQMRQMMTILAQSLGLAVDPGTGRLRVVLQDVSYGAAGQSSNVNVGIQASANNVGIAYISNTNQGGNKPDTLIFDAMQNVWANSVNPCIARS